MHCLGSNQLSQETVRTTAWLHSFFAMQSPDSYEVIILRQAGFMDASKDTPMNIITLYKICRTYFSKEMDTITGERIINFLSSQLQSLSTKFEDSEFDPELSVPISPCLGLKKV